MDCELVITVINRRSDEPLHLTTIDVGESYLEGFNVVGTEPSHKSSIAIPIDYNRSYTFDADIAAGATNVFTSSCARLAKAGSRATWTRAKACGSSLSWRARRWSSRG